MHDEGEASEDLVERVRVARDRDAFGALFDRHGPRIKAYLVRGGVDAETADDLTQEVMLVLWRKADRFDVSRASLDTWLFTVARNKRIDALRRHRWPTIDPDDAATVPDPARRPDREADRNLRSKRLREALRGLPAEQAQVLADAYGGGQSLRAIAEARGLPLGTVKSRSRLAMARLRAVLGDAAEEDAS